MKDLVIEVMREQMDRGRPKINPCPVCGAGYTKVVSSYQRSIKGQYPGKRRVRVCRHCNYRFSTVEILDSDYKQLVDTSLFVGKFLASLGTNVEFMKRLDKVVEDE